MFFHSGSSACRELDAIVGLGVAVLGHEGRKVTDWGAKRREGPGSRGPGAASPSTCDLPHKRNKLPTRSGCCSVGAPDSQPNLLVTGTPTRRPLVRVEGTRQLIPCVPDSGTFSNRKAKRAARETRLPTPAHDRSRSAVVCSLAPATHRFLPNHLRHAHVIPQRAPPPLVLLRQEWHPHYKLKVQP